MYIISLFCEIDDFFPEFVGLFMVDFRINWTLRSENPVRNADRMKKKSACGNLSLGFTP